MDTGYVDVHCHLTEAAYAFDLPEVIARAAEKGVIRLVANGVGPDSNRRVLALQSQYPTVLAAMGMYPIQAVSRWLPADFPMEVERVEDPDAEIRFIAQAAQAGEIAAIGECGLDAHWLSESTFAEQERVFSALIEVAKQADLPVIVHSRKLEERTYKVLREVGPSKVVFHCWGGRVKRAVEIAEKHGWCFSIPANARRNGAFEKMLRILPEEALLTETDSPYLPPLPGARNEPQNVVDTVAFLATLRNIPVEVARDRVWRNFCRVFSQVTYGA